MNEISPLAYVNPEAKIGAGVIIHPFAYIDKNVVIGDNCVIMPNASILSGTRLGNNNQVYHNTVLGSTPQDFSYHGGDTILEIGNNNVFRENVVISRSSSSTGKSVIGDNNFIMDGVHICHDCNIANHCVIGIKCIIAGNCVIGSHAIFSSMVSMFQDTRVGEWSLVQGGCRLKKDVPPYIVTTTNPTSYYGVNVEVLKHFNVSEKIIQHIAQAYGLIFHSKVSIADALIRVVQEVPMSDEIENIINFIKTSNKGLI
jgi:acyl-[acyl-carrier-protein]--UDP-N-acetylglucosamine O-acyltransferase